MRKKQAAGQALDPGRSPGRHRKISRTEKPALRHQVMTHPDTTLAEHCAMWGAGGKTQVSPATMRRALTRLGLPLNKRR